MRKFFIGCIAFAGLLTSGIILGCDKEIKEAQRHGPQHLPLTVPNSVAS